MNGVKTEIAAGLTAILNGIFGLLAAFGIINLSPEIIASINGVMIPVVIMFLGSRVARVENTGVDTNKTAKRVEAAQPEPGTVAQTTGQSDRQQAATTGSQSAYASASSNGGKPESTSQQLVKVTK